MFKGLQFAQELPSQPGVYRMYDAGHKLLYVGKAKNLQKRVSSYFQKTHEEKRLQKLVSEIQSIEVTTVPTELDALLLESQLIKQLQPKYNILLRNNKGYPYLAIRLEDDYPKFFIHQGPKEKNVHYVGPFISKTILHHHKDLAQKNFKLRTCDDHYFKHRSRACLEYQIGRCSAPCVGHISKADYHQSAINALESLKGNNKAILESLKEKMNAASQSMEYEKAALLRDQIFNLQKSFQISNVEGHTETFDTLSIHVERTLAAAVIVHVSEGKILDTKHFHFNIDWLDAEYALEQYLSQTLIQDDFPWNETVLIDLPEERRTLLEQATHIWRPHLTLKHPKSDFEHGIMAIAKKSAKEYWAQQYKQTQFEEGRWASLCNLLQAQAPHLSSTDLIIECIDISHTQGTNTVASCVSMGAAGPIKNRYRRFLINGITPGDDYAAIEQAVQKRLSSKLPLPDVLIIDGGIGQLKRAQTALAKTSAQIPLLMSISKGPERKAGEETLHFLSGETLEPGPHSHALQLLQVVRDESHRFAIEGQRKKQNKQMTQSILETIPGLGKQKRKALLTDLGGWQGIKEASVETLQSIKGIGPTLASLIYEAIHGTYPVLEMESNQYKHESKPQKD